MKNNIWIFLKYSAKFFEIILGIMYSFVLYEHLFGSGLIKEQFSPEWAGIILALYFIVSVEAIIVINESLLPYFESKLLRAKAHSV